MKKCRRCSKPATMHITEIREGKATAIHLCDTCAREYLESSSEESPAASTSDVTSKLEELTREGSDESLAGLSCPNCGITFSEFRETGRFGCPGDYSEFMAQILPLLENIHEDSTHIGKRPRSKSVSDSGYSRMIQLRKNLQDAVECEDYESAAKIRDEIAALESEMRTPPRDEAPEPEATQTPVDPPEKPARRRRSRPDQSPE